MTSGNAKTKGRARRLLPLACGSALIAALAMVGVASNAQVATSFDIPTGGSPSPLFGAEPFTQKMMLFEEFGTQAVPGSSCPTCKPLPAPTTCTGGPTGAALDTFLKQQLSPAPTVAANTSSGNPWATKIGSCVRKLASSSIEGRPSGEWFTHQRWSEFPPQVYFQSAQAGARTNNGMRNSLQRHHYFAGEFGKTLTGKTGLYYNGGTTAGTEVRIHPLFPVQNPNSVWTFDGTLPPKLLMARYGEPILFRHYNALPIDAGANNGFGAHTISTHEHNGHNPSESDGYTAAFFFPGQFYDYHWPMQLAGRDSINKLAQDPRAGAPTDTGGVKLVPGDFRETMSTHWFHDHMLDYTAQNVYKGNAAMMNYYSAIDPGNDGTPSKCNYFNSANPNLCLPSGSALQWGNRDYDVNLVIADKAWDAKGQLWFNVFNTDGFLGDRVTVNWQWKPYLEVRARRYRFRILNGSVSRYYKIAVVKENGERLPFYMVANDGNIMEHAVPFPNAQSPDLPEQGIAERYDIVVDFSTVAPNSKVYFVNLLEHQNPRGPSRTVPLADVLSGAYQGDPGVGKFLEFRVVNYTGTDTSMDPAAYVEGGKVMIPRPEVSDAEIAAATRHTFDFGRANGTDDQPWTIKTDGGVGFGMDPHRVSVATKGQWEVWRISSGSGWAHPVHIHFEEGRILTRDGAAPPIWERGARKDVYHIGDGPDSSNDVELLIRFREFLGSYMEHCHNTQHEDNSMLLRWDSFSPGQFLAIPTPIATWEGVYYEPSNMLPTAATGVAVGAP